MNMENKKDAARSTAMAKELEWIRKGTRGQQKKGKARQKAYEENVAEAQKSGIAERLESGTIVIPEGPRLGNKVLSVKGLCHQFEDGRPLFNSLDFTVPKGALVGIVGGNGVGKSTLFRLLTGDIGPDRGTIDVGDSVHIGYVSQSRASLNANHTVYEEVAGPNYSQSRFRVWIQF